MSEQLMSKVSGVSLPGALQPPKWNLVSTRTTQFAYFTNALGSPVWRDRKILDFGGNIGTFLVGAGNQVAHQNYWCLDVNQTVVERGRKNFPQAHFVHFNRYNSQFNPEGIRFLRVPDLRVEFDYILAFSVFTHTDRSEMIELVEQLRAMLAPGGALAFTFCDARYDRTVSDPTLFPASDVRKNLERERHRNSSSDIDLLVERAFGADWCVVIDEDVHVNPGDELNHQRRAGRPLESYCSYFTTGYMSTLFPDAEIRSPVRPEWQHCCILRRE